MIEGGLSSTKKKVMIRLPYDKAGLAQTLHSEGAVIEARYLEDAIELDVVVSSSLYGRFRDNIVES
jgi:50S ribosomal subunit-associated GTPase HflX